VIVAEQLTKRFGAHVAVNDVSFRVGRGSVVGFLGPNGAGKTTTLRLLAGVFPPNAGRALIDGLDLAVAPRAAHARLGYAPERPALWPEMRVGGLLAFVATMKGVARSAADDVLTRTGLGTVRDQRVRTLSRGWRQRVGLAVALVGDPPALLLDEPLAGLDPAQSAEARHMIRDLGRDRAILVSSHALAEVEAMCDRVVILHHGRVLAEGTPATLAARLRPLGCIEVEVEADAAVLSAALEALDGVRAVEHLAEAGGRTRCRLEAIAGRDVRPEVAALIADRGWRLLELRAVETSLEEAFLRLTAAA
jgi:ABC-2 type transport system ATP-binding protein